MPPAVKWAVERVRAEPGWGGGDKQAELGRSFSASCAPPSGSVFPSAKWELVGTFSEGEGEMSQESPPSPVSGPGERWGWAQQGQGPRLHPVLSHPHPASPPSANIYSPQAAAGSFLFLLKCRLAGGDHGSRGGPPPRGLPAHTRLPLPGLGPQHLLSPPCLSLHSSRNPGVPRTPPRRP